jgi:hypothetical protein
MHASSDSAERRDTFEIAAKILENIASKMPHSVADLEKEEQDVGYWQSLRWDFETEIDKLEKSLQSQ